MPCPCPGPKTTAIAEAAQRILSCTEIHGAHVRPTGAKRRDHRDSIVEGAVAQDLRQDVLEGAVSAVHDEEVDFLGGQLTERIRAKLRDHDVRWRADQGDHPAEDRGIGERHQGQGRAAVGLLG